MARKTPPPIHGLLHPACGPVLRVRVRSPTGAQAEGLAVLDTGASLSAIDRRVALDLGLPSPGAAEWHAVTDTGAARAMAPLRRAAVQMMGDSQLFELDLIEVPSLQHAVRGSTVVALLGWNFLDRCRLVCDGPAGTFVLELPDRLGPAHRRR